MGIWGRSEGIGKVSMVEFPFFFLLFLSRKKGGGREKIGDYGGGGEERGMKWLYKERILRKKIVREGEKEKIKE